MRLYANGCSFTFGYGLNNRNILPPEYPSPQDHVYAIAHSWPQLTADMLGWNCVNDAIPSGSNDRMLRTTLAWLTANCDSETFVILGFTDAPRRELYLPEQNYYLPLTAVIENNIQWLKRKTGITEQEATQISTNNMRYGWDELESYTRYYGQVLLISSYLRQRKIPYLFCNMLADGYGLINYLSENYADVSDAASLHNAIDWSDFIEYQGSVDSVFLRFCKDLSDNSLDHTGHPTQSAHDQFAGFIYDKIKARD